MKNVFELCQHEENSKLINEKYYMITWNESLAFSTLSYLDQLFLLWQEKLKRLALKIKWRARGNISAFFSIFADESR